MNGSRARVWALLLAGFATTAPVVARAAISVPACPALAAWVARFDTKDRTALSQTNKELWLHGLLLAKETEELFGKRALDWSAEDVGEADTQIAACSNEARLAGPARTFEAKALQTFRGAAFKQLGSVLQAASDANKRIDDALSALLALPPTPDLLRALAAIGKAQGGAAEMAAANADLAAVPYVPALRPARALWVALRDGLTGSGERVFPAVAKRLTELRQIVLQEATTALAAQPATPEGREAVDALLAKTRSELRNALAPADLAALDAAAAARRDAIEEGILVDETARIAQVPVDFGGLQALQVIRNGPGTALSRSRAAAFAHAVDGREGEIVNGIVDTQVALLDGFPASLAGLRDLEVFRQDSVRALEALVRPRYASRFVRAWIARKAALSAAIVDQQVAGLDRVTGTLAGLREIESYRAEVVPTLQAAVGVLDAARLIDAVDARTDALASEALPEFRDTLAAFPANEEGMIAFNATMAGLEPILARLRKPLQEQYAEVARAKRAALKRGVAE